MNGENSINDFKRGDKVIILIGDGDSAKFGMVGPMRRVKGEKAVVDEVNSSTIRVRHPKFRGSIYLYAPHELSIVRQQQPIAPPPPPPTTPAEEPDSVIQSHDELVAENESLEKQIRKLEARVERKKEFQRQNVRKIAAWRVILEKEQSRHMDVPCSLNSSNPQNT